MNSLLPALVALTCCAHGDQTVPQGASGREQAAPEKSAGSAQPKRADDEPQEPATPAGLRLVSSRDRYAVGEPIVLIVALRNRTDQALRVPPPKSVYLRLELSGPGLEGWERYPLPERRVQLVDIASGAEHAEPFDLHLRNGRWWLTKPGEYRVRARYAPKPLDGSANSETWSAGAELDGGLTLVTPAAGVDARCAELVMSLGVTKFIVTPNTKTYDRAAKSLAEIQACKSKNGVVPYVELCVGQWWGQSRFDPETRTFVSDDERAAVHLERAARRSIDPVVAARSTRLLYESLNRLDRGDEAKRAWQTFESSWRDAIRRLPGIAVKPK